MLNFKVPDMHCDGCVAAVTKAVRALDPTASVAVDLATHTVNVTSAQPAKAIAAAIEDAGFSVEAAG